MINGKKILAVIPARGGSKGVPRKNIRVIAGKPLIAWTIEEAKKSKYIDKLILSSDDEEIIEAAKKYGCEAPFVRPKELAQDDTPGVLPVLHAVEQMPGYDYVVLLQPTSPLRLVEDIDGCIHQCVFEQSSSCVTVTQSPKHPYWMYYIDQLDNKLRNVIDNTPMISRRQDLPVVYVLNGAVYVADISVLIKTKELVTSETTAYIMPDERALDIDTEFDMKLLNTLHFERMNMFENNRLI